MKFENKQNYEAPLATVVEVSVERGFEVSTSNGFFDGPTYGEEEDIIW